MTPRDALPIALALAERRHASEGTGGGRCSVMVAPYVSTLERRRRHLRLYRDAGGLYVRTGKRAVRKLYLSGMAGARIVDAALGLAVFYET